jgi:hypothetical protein
VVAYKHFLVLIHLKTVFSTLFQLTVSIYIFQYSFPALAKVESMGLEDNDQNVTDQNILSTGNSRNLAHLDQFHSLQSQEKREQNTMNGTYGNRSSPGGTLRYAAPQGQAPRYSMVGDSGNLNRSPNTKAPRRYKRRNRGKKGAAEGRLTETGRPLAGHALTGVTNSRSDNVSQVESPRIAEKSSHTLNPAAAEFMLRSLPISLTHDLAIIYGEGGERFISQMPATKPAIYYQYPRTVQENILLNLLRGDVETNYDMQEYRPDGEEEQGGDFNETSYAEYEQSWVIITEMETTRKCLSVCTQ